jgi:hypothetical protein
MAKKASSSAGNGASDKPITDPRFENFQTDPRFRLPSTKRSRTVLDKRFAPVLRNNDFIGTSRVDRYGRKIKSDTKKKALQRLYRTEEEGDDASGTDEAEDDDVEVRKALKAANAKHDPARGGGFSSSEEETDEEEVLEDLEEDVALDRLEPTVETGEVTKRLAVVNLDWDHVKSVDLMALFSSFLPSTGRIQKVTVYPSEFGKERMGREEMEGPPQEIFKKQDPNGQLTEQDDDSDPESEVDSDEEIKKELLKEAADDDFDSNALRSYQLNRLRYFYAVVVCSDRESAQKIYEAVDGTEYLASSNFLDLRFIPEEVTFDDDEPRDECTTVPDAYKPLEFVTEALQSSKVKLTWDMDPEESTRKDSIRKAFTGSKKDIAENDLHAYLASDSDGEEQVFGQEETTTPLQSKRELARRKMREALGLSNDAETTEDPKDAKDGLGEMQITFTPALMGDDAKGKKIDVENETTVEKYMRKERDRKEKKREKAKAKRDGKPEPKETKEVPEAQPGEDLGFDDPFFTTEPEKPTKSALRKQERQRKRAAREAQEAETAAQKAVLESVMADDANETAGHSGHFDMRDIIQAEKAAKKKRKAKGKKDKVDKGDLQQDIDLHVEDSRFKALFEKHDFAIDPSNPTLMGTEGMRKLLAEGMKRKHRDEVDGESEEHTRKKGNHRG